MATLAQAATGGFDDGIADRRHKATRGLLLRRAGRPRRYSAPPRAGIWIRFTKDMATSPS